MSGSMKWFVYTTDAGLDTAIWRDESNTEAVNGGTQDYVDGLAIVNALPSNIRPRTLYYVSADGRYQKKIVALTQAIYAGAQANVPTINQDGITYVLRTSKGEQIRRPIAVDTRIDDGDAT